MRFRSLLLATTALALSAGAAFADIRIAVVGPMTGPNASFGDQLKAGAAAAADDINSHGGIGGEKIEIVVADDACDPRQAVSVANKLIADGITFVNGHFCSGATLPASEVYEESGVVSLTVSTNPQITERGFKSIFRIGGRDDQQGPTASHYILKHFLGRKIAIIDDKSAFGAGLTAEVKSALTAAGQPIVMEARINAGEKDYSALITRLKEAGTEVVYFGGYHAEAGLIMRQSADLGLKLTLFGGDPLSSSEFVAIAGATAEGTLFTFGPDPRKNPEAGAAVDAMRKRGIEPQGWALYSYGIIQTFAQALGKAGSTDPQAVAEALRQGSFETVLGTVKFDAKGDNQAPGFVVYKWSGGQADYARD
ncbi:ABC transporter substrate-binding protein [Mesorhizobium shangrilense]|uniref:ABC transporter substrate-binding protein n=1 Tax=Mesorhizobium shangrilense TaxID=460060 RepID=A0ABV2DR82_9HYPH